MVRSIALSVREVCQNLLLGRPPRGSVIGDPVPCLLHGTVTYALLPMTRDVNVPAHLARFLPRGRR